MTLTFSKIGVVGAGAMGRGIAQVAAQAGAQVLLHDLQREQAVQARAFIGTMFQRAAEKGRLSPEAAEAALERVRVVEMPEFAEAELIVEAIVEDLEIKQRLLRQLEELVSDSCVLATNTSSLSVTRIAAGSRLPERVAGWHFFNPVPLMKVVEVIGGPRTDPEVLERLTAFTQEFGHSPVRAEDSPGFLVNHAGRGLTTEGLRLLQEGIAQPWEIDEILRDCAGFRMGPFELLDLTGLDVSFPVMEQIYEQFYHEPRFRPTPELSRRHAAGLLGRKTGAGFYRYESGTKVPVGPSTFARGEAASVPVWVSPSGLSPGAEELRALLEQAGADVEPEGAAPSSQALCLAASQGADVTTLVGTLALDPRRTVGVDTLFGLDKRRVLMVTPVTRPELREQARTLLEDDPHPVTIIRDSPGSVAARVLAVVVNIACDLAQQRIASPKDIDLAVRLGLGYPKGPLEWGDEFGAQRILTVLEALHHFYRDPRYRPSPWLLRRALLDVSLRQPE